MSAAVMIEQRTELSFRQLVKSLPAFSLNSLVCNQGRKMKKISSPVVLIDDDPAFRTLGKYLVSKAMPEAELVVCETLMSAARYLPSACAVIVDWRLEDMTAGESGIIKMLTKNRIPFFVWTAESFLELDCDVVAKGDNDIFKDTLKKIIPSK